MKLLHSRIIWMSVALLSGWMAGGFQVGQAQDGAACPALFRTALLGTQLECEPTGNEQVCYGSTGISATTEPEASSAPFNLPGHLLPAAHVRTLAGTGMDTSSGAWGLALVRLEADAVPDVATLAAFGDFTLENLSAGLVTTPVRVTHTSGALARRLPSTNSEVTLPLARGQVVLAAGRTGDGEWLRVMLPGAEVGWVLASLVTFVEPGAVGRLDVADAEDGARRLYRPFRALEFRSGVLDAPCPSVPESGLLVQTPGSDATLTMLVNGVTLQVDGTVFLQAQTEEVLVINVLEGQALAHDEAGSLTLDAGSRWESAAEASAEPYTYARMEMLPLELLPRPVLIAVDWVSALIPARDNPLQGLGPTDPCTVAVVNDVNVRVGPGRDFAVRGSMLANQSARPTGRAAGTDGRVWWRITDGAWISFDVIFAAGACESLPLVEALPRPTN